MALTAKEILHAKERLAEHNWKLWTGEEGANDTSVAFTRYIGGLNEIALDSFLEFLRRFVSVKNHTAFNLTVSGGTDPDVNGTYEEQTSIVNGHSVFLRSDGAYKFQVAISTETGAYYWQLIDTSDDIVKWVSSGGSVITAEIGDDITPKDIWTISDDGYVVPKKLGDEAASLTSVVWTSATTSVEMADDIEIEDGWDISDAGVDVPVSTGDLAVGYTLPGDGIQHRSVEDPQVNNGKVRDGVWRAGELAPVNDFDGRYGCKGAWVIVQTLYLELNTTAPITSSESRWRIRGGSNYRGSNQMKILELPYCDPKYAEAMSEENTDETYTGTIYTLNGQVLTGTWHNLDCTYEIDKETGWATLIWYLSKQANDDIHFAYQKGDGTFVVDMFKFDAADTGLQAFETTYYFDDEGNWYISSDGSTFTQKNGVDEDPAGDLTAEPEYGGSLGNIRTQVSGRVAGVQIIRSEKTRFYTLHAHIEFVSGRDYSVAWRRDKNAIETEIKRHIGADDLESFPGNCYVKPSDGDVEITTGTPTAGYYALNDNSVEMRSVRISSEYDTELSMYLVKATVVHITARTASYFEHPNGDRTYYGFRVESAPDLSALAATYVISIRSFEQHADDTYTYVIYARKAKETPTGGDDTATYGTALVTVQDQLVSGVASLPDASSGVGYNAAGTKEIETQIIRPNFEPESGTFSYIKRTVEKWAPHADQVTGDVGYIEGPSEIRTEPEVVPLARGVGSGFPALGGWSGGGLARIRWTQDCQDGYEYTSTPTGQAQKKFQPYLVTVARVRNLRTTTRMYYYVKEPTESQYPTTDSWFTKESIEDKAYSDVGNSNYPHVTDVVVKEDTTETFGAKVTVNGNDIYGQLVTYTYSDGTIELMYWNPVSVATPAGSASIQDGYAYEVKFIRTYPGTGTDTGKAITTVTNSPGVGIECYTSTAHGLSVGDQVRIDGTTNYDGTYEVVAVDTTNTFEVAATFVANDSGTAYTTQYGDGTVKVDEVNLKSDPYDTLSDDDGLYMGHYQIAATSFYTDAMRHRIMKVAESVYALVVEKIEKTPWQLDHVNKWFMNTEGQSMMFAPPPAHPVTGGSGVINDGLVI